MQRKLQCKDIPDLPILKMLAKNPLQWHNWNWTEWNVCTAMPDGIPPKLALAKMRRLINRGLVDGCPCGCRGDFVITEKGLEVVAAETRRFSQFALEWLGIPQEPSTPIEKRLRELGEEYHAVTEAYDRQICTGPIVRGSIQPNNAQELSAINRHALKVRDRLMIEAERLGASRADLQAAIRAASRRPPNTVQGN